MTQSLQSQEWYQELCSEAQAIIVEAVFNARDTVIRGKWILGQRILQDKENFEKAGITGGAIILTCQKDMDISVSELYACVKFAERFPDLEKFMSKQPKSLNWHRVVHELLIENPQPHERPARCVCAKCGNEHVSKK